MYPNTLRSILHLLCKNFFYLHHFFVSNVFFFFLFFLTKDVLEEVSEMGFRKLCRDLQF